MNTPHSLQNRTIRVHKGFTLIELLTVIAIIGILAAIIIPTVGAVRKSAQSSQTMSNLRQIGQALQVYASDNKERLPGGWNIVEGESYISWHRVLYNYVGLQGSAREARTSAVYQCGIAQSLLQFGPTVNDANKLNFTANGYYMTDFAFSASGNGSASNPPPAKVSSIRTPSQAVLVFDGVSINNTDPGIGTSSPFFQDDGVGNGIDDRAVNVSLTDKLIIQANGHGFAFRHSGGTKMYAVMADSSVRSFKVGELLNRHIKKQR